MTKAISLETIEQALHEIRQARQACQDAERQGANISLLTSGAYIEKGDLWIRTGARLHNMEYQIEFEARVRPDGIQCFNTLQGTGILSEIRAPAPIRNFHPARVLVEEMAKMKQPGNLQEFLKSIAPKEKGQAKPPEPKT